MPSGVADDLIPVDLSQGYAPSLNPALRAFGVAALFDQAWEWLGSLFGKVTAVFAPVTVEARSLAVEVPEGQIWKNYILVGGQRVAMREYTATTSEVYFLLSDHLGSTSIVTDESGTLVSELRYSAYGEERYSSGDTPTDYRYTGQLSQATIGLYYYGARWYDPVISHFIQADTIVPGTGNPKAWDRYAYVLWNPVNYNDPSGHVCSDPEDPTPTCENKDPRDQPSNKGNGGGTGQNGLGNGSGLNSLDNPMQGMDLTGAGQRVYELFWWLRLQSRGTFTLHDLLALVLGHELWKWGGIDSALSLFTEAAGRWFYTNYGGLSAQNVFNWLGNSLQSAGGLLTDTGGFQGLYSDFIIEHKSISGLWTGVMVTEAYGVADAIFNPEAAWLVADRNKPYAWGGAELVAATKLAEYYNLKSDKNGIHRGSVDVNDVWFKQGPTGIFSLNQLDYWKNP